MGLRNKMGFRGKKAMVFTLLTIVILFVFLLSYSLYSVVNEGKRINKRIDSMNNFVFSTEKDLERQIYISGFRIIFLIEKKITETGNTNWISNLNSSFNESFFYGTLDGEYQDLLDDAKFFYISNEINKRADKMNIEVNLTPHKFYVSQDDPWHVKVNLETDVLIRDKGNLALWNKTETISSYISIENFEDPLYIMNIRIPNKINKTIYRPFVNDGDVSNLSLHAQNSYYIESSTGPSFLDRLEGKTTPNPNGIESLVYLPSLSAQGIEVEDKSVVDYIYFSSDNPTSHKIQGMPAWFKLDDNHLSNYNLDSTYWLS